MIFGAVRLPETEAAESTKTVSLKVEGRLKEISPLNAELLVAAWRTSSTGFLEGPNALRMCCDTT